MKNLLPVFSLCMAAACQSGSGPSPAVAKLFPDQATFEVTNTLTVPVPAGSKQVRLWFPLPRSDEAQTVTDEKVEAPTGWREATDQNKNRYVYAQVDSPGEKVVVKTTFKVTRKEQNASIDAAKSRPLTAEETK